MGAATQIDPRYLQANERTLLAWSRTGLALMAFGFVIDRMALWFRYELHREERGSLLLGSIAIALGAGCQLVGAVRFVAMRRTLMAGGATVQRVVGPIVVVALVALLGCALLIFLLVS
jgi:putative membrane protein